MTTQQNTLTSPPPPQRPSNAERLTQWRAVAERTGNQRLLNTINLLEIRYANEATRPPAPTLKGGAQ